MRGALGKSRGVHLLQEVERILLRGIGLAQLGLDRAQLLPQVELAVVRLDFHFGLLAHVLHDPGAAEFLLELAGDEVQAALDVQLLQHLVPVGDAEAQVRRREVGKPPGVGDVHLEERGHVLGHAIHELRERLCGCHDPRHERAPGLRVRGRLARRPDTRERIGRLLVQFIDDDPPQPLQRDLHRVAGEVDALVHPGRDAHATDERLRVAFVGLARCHRQGHDQPRLSVVPQKREVFGGTHLHGHGAVRKDERRAERHERQHRRQLGCGRRVRRHYWTVAGECSPGRCA